MPSYCATPTAAFPNIITVPYGEVKGSPQESYSGGTLRVKRVLHCAWNNRWKLAADLVGTCKRERVPGLLDGSGNPIHAVRRKLPHFYPDYPTEYKNRLVCTAIESVEGVGPRGGNFEVVQNGVVTGRGDAYAYEVANVTALYESVTYNMVTDDKCYIPGPQLSTWGAVLDFKPDESSARRFVTRFIQPSAEALTLPHASYRWCSKVANERVPIMGSHALLIATAEVHYTWHQVPGRPSAMTTHLGAVNEFEFDGYPAGTLLLLASEFKPYRMVNGERVADITYKMKHFHAKDPESGVPLFSENIGLTPNEAMGHNFFLQYFSKKNVVTKPRYNLITHDGFVGDGTNTYPGTNPPSTPAAGEVPGVRVFPKKSFRDLFNPDQPVLPDLDPNPNDDPDVPDPDL